MSDPLSIPPRAKPGEVRMASYQREMLNEVILYGSTLALGSGRRSTVNACVYHGWLEKRDGRWYITDAGRAAVATNDVNRRQPERAFEREGPVENPFESLFDKY